MMLLAYRRTNLKIDTKHFAHVSPDMTGDVKIVLIYGTILNPRETAEEFSSYKEFHKAKPCPERVL